MSDEERAQQLVEQGRIKKWVRGEDDRILVKDMEGDQTMRPLGGGR